MLFRSVNNSGALHVDTNFPWVAPKLRTYPANYPGLQGATGQQNYYNTGAVFYSGIVTNSDGGTPVNLGYLCFNGLCERSFAITFSDKSVMTSVEYGWDNPTGGGGTPVLYWNQVPSQWAWNGQKSYYSSFPHGNSLSNSVKSCQLASKVSSVRTSSPCASQVSLAWPPDNDTSVGPWVNEMAYLPKPAGSTSTFSPIGSLIMSVWSPSYLVYHPLTGNSGTALLFNGNGSYGNLPANINGIDSDTNSSVFFQAGAEGLTGFNLFAPPDQIGRAHV